MQKIAKMLLVIAIVLAFTGQTCLAYDVSCKDKNEPVYVDSINTNSVTVNLDISGGIAKASSCVVGKNGTIRIDQRLSLQRYHEGTRKWSDVKNWSKVENSSASEFEVKYSLSTHGKYRVRLTVSVLAVGKNETLTKNSSVVFY